jgi:hypothetical protein
MNPSAISPSSLPGLLQAGLDALLNPGAPADASGGASAANASPGLGGPAGPAAVPGEPGDVHSQGGPDLAGLGARPAAASDLAASLGLQNTAATADSSPLAPSSDADWTNPAHAQSAALASHRSSAAATASGPAPASAPGEAPAASGGGRREGADGTAAAAPAGAAGGAGSSFSASPVVGAATLQPTVLAALQAGPVPLAYQRVQPQDEPPGRPRRQAPWPDQDGDADTPHAAAPEEDLPPAPTPVRPGRATDPHDAGWRAALVQALLAQLRHGPTAAQRALHLAADTWLRGRCAVLVFPRAARTADDETVQDGWACVLWRAPEGEVPALRGQRFAARLHWGPAAAAGSGWWAVRAVKDHPAQRGRQLASVAEGLLQAHGASPGLHWQPAGPRVSLELQLGPAAAPAPRCTVLGVHVAEAQRFWAALGTPWSLPVLACRQPLLAEAMP